MFSKYSVRAAIAVVACAFTLSLASHAEVSVGSKTARPLITQKIDESKLVTLVGNTSLYARHSRNDRGPVAEDLKLNHMQMQLKRSPEQEKALSVLMDQLHTPGNPNFHQWLSEKEWEQSFGVNSADVEKVATWLQSHGFTVESTKGDGMVIQFSGTAAMVREAFHTEIHNLVLKNGEKHISNMTDPKIPAALADVVVGPNGLNNFFPKPLVHKLSNVMIDKKGDLHHAEQGPDGKYTFAGCGFVAGTNCNAFTPGDAQKIYNVSPLYTQSTPITGKGQTIGLIEDSNYYLASDWTTFESTFGLTSYGGSLSQVQPAGTMTCTSPGDVAGTDLEVELDIEYSAAMAPGAAVIVESCADSALFGGLAAVQNLSSAATIAAPVISVSYGFCEAGDTQTEKTAFVAAYQQGAARGMSIFVSSGDESSTSCDADADDATHGINVSGWTSTPYNVSVGGTDFGDTYAGTNSTYWGATNSATYESALSYIPEIPWNDSCASELIATKEGTPTTYGSAGFCNTTLATEGNPPNFLTTGSGSGGPSNCYTGTPGVTEVGTTGTCVGQPKPSWQSVFGNPADGVRDIPDVSLFAANGVWNHYIVICYSNPGRNLGGEPCTGAPSSWTGVGGTSASSPMMAGIQALINQSTGQLQGNPNYILYSLARTEYGASGSSTCNSTLGNGTSSSCIFYDVTQGDNNVNCLKDGSTLYNCYLPSGTNGVGTLTNGSNSPIYNTTTGWDFATGIGTVNALNLANAWKAYANNTPTVAVTTSPANLAAGQVDTWSVTVTGSGSYPTGSIAFSVSGTAGTVATVNLPLSATTSTPCTTTCSSTASYAYTVPGGTAAGLYTVTAAYSAVNEQYPTASGTGTYNVTANSTTSTLSASPSTIAFGASTTLTGVISWPTTTAINPTGNVVFSSSVAQEGTFETLPLSSCTISLSAKTATCSYLWTPTYGGTQTITAAYSGDTNYSASSATTTLNVTQNSTSTTLSINPSTVTETVIGTTYSTVTTYTGASAPTGTVTLGGTPTGGPALSVNVSTCTTNTSAKTISCAIPDPNAWNEYENGIYEVTATYSGDPGDAPSTSAAQQFVVAGTIVLTPTFTLGTTSSTYAVGGTTVATIGLAGTRAGGVPSGTITITGTGTLGTLATITLPTATNSQCTLATRTWTCTATLTIPAGTAAGAYTLTATTSGNAEYLPESKTATYTINKATPTAAASNVSGGYESTVTLSATDTGVTNGVAPTGTVTFTVNGTTATGTPSCSGSALVETCTLSYTTTAAETTGTYPITAVFATDTNYLASSTATATLTITASTASFGTMSFSPAATEPMGTSQAITISDTLTFNGAKPSGAVTYVLNGVTYTATCGATSPATCTATVPAATIAALAVNTYTVTAALAAGGGYSATTGTSGTFTITAAATNVLTFSSVSHNFGQVAVGTAATAYGISVKNTSTTMAYPFTLNFTAAHGFTDATNCPASIAAGGTCEIVFYFTPTATGPVSATWSLVTEGGFSYSPSNGGTLQGSGTSNGGVSLTTNGHNFGTVAVGTTSSTYGTELSNSTASAETLTLGPVPSGPFTMLTNCGTTLAAGASCEIEFTFTPTTTSVVQVVVPLSGSPTAITSGGVALPSGGITLTGN